MKIDSLKKINFIYIIIAIVIILGIVIRTKLLLLNPSFWVDTYSLAENIDKLYFDFFKPLEHHQVAPPFFMMVSKFILGILNTNSSFDVKDFGLRLFPYICGILTLPLFAIMLQKLYKNELFTLVGTFILSFNQYAIYYSIEFKQYSCELLFSILLVIIFNSINFEKISTKRLYWYSLLFVIAPWFSHSSWLIIFLGIIYLILKSQKLQIEHKQKLKIILFPMYINLLIFITQYYQPIYNNLYVSMKKYWQTTQPSFFQIDNFGTLFSSKLNDLLPVVKGINFWLFWFVNLILLFIQNKKQSFTMILPIICIIFASFFNIYPFESRLILFLMPFFIIISTQAILFLNYEKYKIITCISIIIISIFAIKEYIQPIENHLILKSNSRELFYLLKEKNPNLENIITYDIVYPYQSNREDYLVEKVFAPFQKSNIPNYFSVLETGTYWLYIPFGKEVYLNDLKKYLKSTKNVKSLEFYAINNNHHNKLVQNEQGAFIAKVEL